MAFNKIREIFGLAVWEGVPLEVLADKHQNQAERLENWAKKTDEALASFRTSTQDAMSKWEEVRKLRWKKEDCEKVVQLAREALNKGVEREIEVMKKSGETEKVFTGRFVTCSIIRRGDEFFFRREFSL